MIPIEIIDVNIEDIKPYKKNPRKNDKTAKELKGMIKKYGFNNPIVITSDGEIINGHTRYKAMKALGKKSIPCIKKDNLSKREIKEYRIADNKVAEMSEWDETLLGLEIEDLCDLGSDLKDLGFSKSELDDLLNFDKYDIDEEEPEQPKVSTKKAVECPECGHKFTP